MNQVSVKGLVRIEIMRALVTGGGGFLGGAIVGCLCKRNETVQSFSRGVYPGLEKWGVKHFRGDLADSDALEEACSGCDVVFHVAAKAGIWGRYKDFYRVNVVGTRNVIQACRSLGISRLVYTSSPSVVFDGRDMEGIDETAPYPQRYKAHYPSTKAEAEQLVLDSNDCQLATVALRPHLIWGPGDTHLVPGILARGKAGRLRKVGHKSRLVDFTFVDDAAEAHVLAAERLSPGSSVAGKVFFISQGEPVLLWDFIDRILAAGKLPPVKKPISPTTAYALGWLCEHVYGLLGIRVEPPITRFLAEELATAHWFDISAARRELAYEPSVSVDDGLRQLQVWLEARRSNK